jgi:hypothetical protein
MAALWRERTHAGHASFLETFGVRAPRPHRGGPRACRGGVTLPQRRTPHLGTLLRFGSGPRGHAPSHAARPCMQGNHLAREALRPALRPRPRRPTRHARRPVHGYRANHQTASSPPRHSCGRQDRVAPTSAPVRPLPDRSLPSLCSCSTCATSPCTGIERLTAPRCACTATGLCRPPCHRRRPPATSLPRPSPKKRSW